MQSSVWHLVTFDCNLKCILGFFFTIFVFLRKKKCKIYVYSYIYELATHNPELFICLYIFTFLVWGVGVHDLVLLLQSSVDKLLLPWGRKWPTEESDICKHCKYSFVDLTLLKIKCCNFQKIYWKLRVASCNVIYFNLIHSINIFSIHTSTWYTYHSSSLQSKLFLYWTLPEYQVYFILHSSFFDADTLHKNKTLPWIQYDQKCVHSLFLAEFVHSLGTLLFSIPVDRYSFDA